MKFVTVCISFVALLLLVFAGPLVAFFDEKNLVLAAIGAMFLYLLTIGCCGPLLYCLACYILSVLNEKLSLNVVLNR